MTTNLSEMADLIADKLVGQIDGDVNRMEDLDADDVAEFSVELQDGRRCLVSVVPHFED